MFKQLTLDDFLKLSTTRKRVAVYREFPCDDLTPYVCFEMVRRQGPGCALLESAIKDKEVGRYSLIAFDPIGSMRVDKNHSRFRSNGADNDLKGPALESLRHLLAEMRCAADPNLPPLVGGAVGFLSYDAVRHFEVIPDRHTQGSVPDFLFDFHRTYIAFDHIKGSITISVVVDGGGSEQTYAKAMEEIVSLKAKLSQPGSREKRTIAAPSAFKDEMSDEAFCEKVKKAKEYIAQGDAFQIVVSRSFQKSFSGSLFDVYRALRMANPSPFMFYIETEELAVAGASPERLIKLEKNKVQTMPIAGTRPRCQEKDDAVGQDLLADPKEDAEHMMLVDLGRNDLGAIAEVGSVQVKELKTVRHFAHVTHLVSILEADLRSGLDALDALKAAFPAGTLSGAPKIRAMQIIDELEESRRGLYGGAVCTIDNNGEMDSCIAIRMAVLQDGIITVRAGAGVVFDSDPMKEAEETRHKAKGVLEAIRMVEEGVL